MQRATREFDAEEIQRYRVHTVAERASIILYEKSNDNRHTCVKKLVRIEEIVS